MEAVSLVTGQAVETLGTLDEMAAGRLIAVASSKLGRDGAAITGTAGARDGVRVGVDAGLRAVAVPRVDAGAGRLDVDVGRAGVAGASGAWITSTVGRESGSPVPDVSDVVVSCARAGAAVQPIRYAHRSAARQ
ncbi:hypothetical protein [Methyloceanibacter sp. wino2]|uniref:hypothetical protein n=1 Tax=Methyloceanibacter sp. wino2 TaxID=2170729 RepID=UPI00131EEDFC|nr:hypothetical protein [Methyloceanibacter sp. wino2]